MKKLYLAAILLFTVAAINAQSFTATNTYIIGDPLFFLEGHTTITNVSSSTKDVAVLRTVNNLFTGHVGYFCWVQCYNSATNLSPDNLTMAPGAFTDIFRGDVETNSIAGISLVSYCFFDVNNPSDSICVDYLYDTTTGITEVSSGKNFISKAYPNPASTFTNFYVNTTKGSKNSRIKFFNMIGAEVKDVLLNDSKNSVKVNISDLKAGIYFYSLWVDGKSTYTGKLMVSKN